MAGLAHLGFAFGGKPLAKKVPLAVFIIAAEFIDIAWIVFALLGIEGPDGAPWSHGLFMSVVWSVLGGVLVGLLYRDLRAGLVVGAVVLSHWLLDFVTHPMGAILAGAPLPPDLFVFLRDSPRIGLGLYNHSVVVATVFELAVTGIGVAVYVLYKSRAAKSGRRAAPAP